MSKQNNSLAASKQNLAQAFQRLETAIDSVIAKTKMPSNDERVSSLEAKLDEVNKAYDQLKSEHDKIKSNNQQVAKVLDESIEKIDQLISEEICQ